MGFMGGRALLLSLALAWGCSSSQTQSTTAREGGQSAVPDTETTAWYRAAISLGDAGETRFFIGLGPSPEAVVRNGREQIPSRYEWVEGARGRELHLLIREVTASKIVARENADGALIGTWTADAPAIGGKAFEIRADPVDAPDPSGLYTLAGESAEALAGTWKFEFEQIGLAKAELVPLGGGALHATILTEGSDFRYLTGNAGGEEIALSMFDGVHAYLVRGSIARDGRRMTGVAHYWDLLDDPFVATRVEADSFEAYDPLKIVESDPDVRVRAEALEPYLGDPFIVEVGGTWCTLCPEIVPVYRRLQRRHREDGLRILMVSIEFTDDADKAAARAERYRELHDIPWEIVPVRTLEDFAEAFPSFPEPPGFPTTVFVGRDGRIHAIHAGFASRANSEVHERHVAEIERLAGEIVEGEAE